MLDCRALLSADERLLCYDGRVDEYSARGARPAAATSPESTEADDTSGAEESFGLPPAASSRTKVDQIDATIVELSRTASGKFVIELANGQVWRQTTSSSLRLAEGDLVVIRRGSLGSHKLTKADTNRSMKVTRVK